MNYHFDICTISPGKGEKVADRPDDGLFAICVDHKSLTALPNAPNVEKSTMRKNI